MMSCPQKDEHAHPSSNLSTPEKDERLGLLHKENRKARLQIKRLKQKIEAVAIQQGVCISNELHSDINSRFIFQIPRRFISTTILRSAIKSRLLQELKKYEMASFVHQVVFVP